ncbi:TPA: hypothetical protein EYO12_01930 [Candidatus Saccharibacteria bacterium]|nr:hypothetical protein [Candidatus Saccharibacteria bacterium]HIO87477.1 hypothetical protein [Candidatus Saccharibacteria bacterium]
MHTPETVPPPETALERFRSKGAYSLAALALTASQLLPTSSTVEQLTVDSPVFLTSNCTDEHNAPSVSDIELLRQRAYDDNKPVARENATTNDDVPKEELSGIHTRLNPEDFFEVERFQLDSIELEVVFKSDSPDAAGMINHIALEELLLWPYKNAHLFERENQHPLDQDSLECIYNYLTQTTFKRPLVLNIPHEFYNFCKNDDQYVSPPIGCTANGSTNTKFFGPFIFDSQIYLTAGANTQIDPEETLRRLIGHELNHWVLGRMYEDANVRPPDSKIKEATAYDIGRFIRRFSDQLQPLINPQQ